MSFQVWPPNIPHRYLCMKQGPTLQRTELEGSAANVLVTNTSFKNLKITSGYAEVLSREGNLNKDMSVSKLVFYIIRLVHMSIAFFWLHKINTVVTSCILDILIILNRVCVAMIKTSRYLLLGEEAFHLRLKISLS